MAENGDGESKASRTPAASQRGWRNWGDHPLVAVVTVAAGIAAVLGYIDQRRDRPAAGEAAVVPVPNVRRCADVAGRWDWLNTGGVVAIAETNTMMWYRVATDPVPTITGTWECDPSNTRRITLRWQQTGMIDTMTVSSDGQRIAGANTQSGFKLSGVRARQ